MATAPTPGRYTPPGQRPKHEPDLYVGFDGNEWGFAMKEVSPRDGADLSKVLGFGPQKLVTTLFADFADADLHTISGLIFLARRQTEGAWISFLQATDGLTYDSTITMRAADEKPAEEPLETDAGEDSPEA